MVVLDGAAACVVVEQEFAAISDNPSHIIVQPAASPAEKKRFLGNAIRTFEFVCHEVESAPRLFAPRRLRKGTTVREEEVVLAAQSEGLGHLRIAPAPRREKRRTLLPMDKIGRDEVPDAGLAMAGMGRRIRVRMRLRPLGARASTNQAVPLLFHRVEECKQVPPVIAITIVRRAALKNRVARMFLPMDQIQMQDNIKTIRSLQLNMP